jgi:uncharacterized protein YkwD
MHRAPRLLLAFLLGTGVITLKPAESLVPAGDETSARKATLKGVSAPSPDIPFNDFDSGAEAALLSAANASRAESGAPPLTMDSGLSRAARAHAMAMRDAHELSHQFDGEPSLGQRIAAASQLQLDQEGENVALDFDAADAHQHLMLSPPHRANLLNSAYNVVGMGVVRSGNRLYIVEDFGHALPKYSLIEIKDRVAKGVNQIRREAGQPELSRRDLVVADSAACSMAEADRFGTPPIRRLAERYTVLSFTSLNPERLPEGANRAITSPNVESFSVGACYARSETYPNGVYWIVVSLD